LFLPSALGCIFIKKGNKDNTNFIKFVILLYVAKINQGKAIA